jgi:hypothetical protein
LFLPLVFHGIIVASQSFHRFVLYSSFIRGYSHLPAGRQVEPLQAMSLRIALPFRAGDKITIKKPGFSPTTQFWLKPRTDFHLIHRPKGQCN